LNDFFNEAMQVLTIAGEEAEGLRLLADGDAVSTTNASVSTLTLLVMGVDILFVSLWPIICVHQYLTCL
jgi:hypothetical protein